jgi:WXG100 family type VII secretion target
MTVSLTPAEAEQKIQQITDARDQAVQKLNQISDTQQTMLASAWRGTSASGYGNTAQQQREEFDQLIMTLNDIVEKGSTHMRSIANLDNG